MHRTSTSKDVLILANSRKTSGRCIAGIELVDGAPAGWVRPVSSRPHGEVSELERRYQDGADPKVLEVARIPLLRLAPALHQVENWLLDPDYYWERLDTVAAAALESLVDSSGLWLSDTADTRFGINDRVDAVRAHKLSDSIRLIRVRDLRYRVFAPSGDFGNHKRRVLAVFTHANVEYRIYVSDPIVEREYLAGEDGWFDVGGAYLTVSLAEQYEGYCYKVVAAVVPY